MTTQSLVTALLIKDAIVLGATLLLFALYFAVWRWLTRPRKAQGIPVAFTISKPAKPADYVSPSKPWPHGEAK